MENLINLDTFVILSMLAFFSAASLKTITISNSLFQLGIDRLSDFTTKDVVAAEANVIANEFDNGILKLFIMPAVLFVVILLLHLFYEVPHPSKLVFLKIMIIIFLIDGYMKLKLSKRVALDSQNNGYSPAAIRKRAEGSSYVIEFEDFAKISPNKDGAPDLSTYREKIGLKKISYMSLPDFLALQDDNSTTFYQDDEGNYYRLVKDFSGKGFLLEKMLSSPGDGIILMNKKTWLHRLYLFYYLEAAVTSWLLIVVIYTK